MADWKNIASVEWAAATRVGPKLGVLGEITDVLHHRVPRVLVPVDLQAFVSSGTTGTGRADVRSRMLDDSPSIRLPDPFTAAANLEPGVHLHWALPDGLTKAAPPPPGGTTRDLGLRPLPDRWLVVRLVPGKAGDKRPTTSWIVESERARALPLASWVAGAAGAANDLPSEKFTAAAGGDLGWAGVYDNVRDRLGFYDDLGDLPGFTGRLAYVVIGWYSKPSLDPLATPTKPARFSDLLVNLGWDVDLSSLPAVDDTYRADIAQVVDLATSMNLFESRPVDRPRTRRLGIDTPAPIRTSPTSTGPVLGVKNLVLADNVKQYVSVLEPRVTRSLYHGTIYGVDVRANGNDARPSVSSVRLTMGSNGIDALSKMLAGPDAVQERMLDAFVYGTIRDFASDNGIVAHDEAVHRHGFGSLPDPSPGIVEHLRAPASAAPQPPPLGHGTVDPAILLGTADNATLKVSFSPNWLAAHDRALAHVQPGVGATTTPHPPATSRPATPVPSFTQTTRPNPRWFVPTDPVIEIRGANRSQRHGYDGRFDPGELLACRLSGQPIRGYADMLHGAEVVPALGHPSLPAECDELLQEAALSDPNAIDKLTELVPKGRGWTVSQIRTRLNAEVVLGYHLQTRDGDVGELLAASLREGVEMSPVGVTYWNQPWVPLYAEWTAEVVASERLSGSHLSEIDFDPPTTVPPEAVTFTLDGRSLLNSSGARTLGSAIQRFIDDEAVADKHGTGIISDDDALDLARLGLAATRSDLLSGALEGLNDHFLGFDTDVAYAPQGGDEPIVSPQRLPQLLRAGWIRLRKLRLVDAFGRVLDLDPRLESLELADALRSTAPPVFATPAGSHSSPTAVLAPRFTAPARLGLRFVDAANDTVEALIDESTPVEVRNPVAGWLLPDHADDALEFFDAAGNALGQLFHRGLRSAVTWEGAPGNPGPIGAGPATSLAGSVHLSRLAVAIAQRDAVERASAQPPAESPLGALLRAIDTTIWTTDPLGAAGTAPLSLLVGRPIAVVRVKALLELQDDTAQYVLGAQDAAGRHAAFLAVAEHGIPLRVGALSRFDDGVLGFFIDDDYSLFHPVHPSILQLARKSGAQRGFLDGVEEAAANGTSFAPDPIVAPFVAGESELILRPGIAQHLTLLVLAGLGINATTGVIPRKRLDLARAWTDAALQRIVPSFRIGPVLVDPKEIRMPRISAMPQGQGGALRNTWTRRDTPTTWHDDAILAATMTARLADRPAVAHEGWVRFAPAPATES